MIMLLLVSVVLIGFGILLGSTWTTQVLDGRFRQHAAERHRLNEEWRAVRAFRAQQSYCARCGDELGWDRQPALVTGALDEDDD